MVARIIQEQVPEVTSMIGKLFPESALLALVDQHVASGGKSSTPSPLSSQPDVLDRAQMKDLSILIVGHACFPNMGSEAGVTWNWAWHLAERNRVWVIAHGFARPSVEQYMRDHPRPNLRFIWVGPLGWWDPWRNPSHTMARGLRLHYLFWRHAALTAAQRLVVTEAIDIVHHVSWNSISAPPLLWRTGKPFVWGPIGGGHVLPWRFLTSIGRAALSELLRNLRVGLMPWTPGLRRAVARTDLLLAANGESASLLRRAGAAHIKLLPDIGIPAELLQPPSPERVANPTLIVLWAGRLLRFKGLATFLRVAKAVRTQDVCFLVAGSGRHQWVERYVRRLGLNDRVVFLGRLPWQELQQRFAEADLFVFTSLRDTFGTVNFEALAKGCPVMCLNHQGVGSHLPDAVAIKVPATTPQAVVQAMARHIDALASDRARLRRMSEAGYSYATTQQWKHRARLMEQLYRQVLAQRGVNQTAL
jgi:glycosyltransferase involved in cell wall biosynthesis